MLFLSVTEGTVPRWLWLVPLAILVPETVLDIRKKTVMVFPIILGSIAGIIINLAAGNGIMKLLAGCIPGLFLLLISIAAGDCIGKGDGEITVMIGLFLGFTETVWVLFFALVTAMVFCLGLLVTKRAGRKSRIPFVPFLLAGMIIRAGTILC